MSNVLFQIPIENRKSHCIQYNSRIAGFAGITSALRFLGAEKVRVSCVRLALPTHASSFILTAFRSSLFFSAFFIYRAHTLLPLSRFPRRYRSGVAIRAWADAPCLHKQPINGGRRNIPSLFIYKIRRLL